jgi:hypothetical protein
MGGRHGPEYSFNKKTPVDRLLCSCRLFAFCACARLTTLAGPKALADVIGSSADAISKLGDSIAHISSLSMAGYDEMSARRTRQRLIDIEAKLVNVHRVANAAVMSGIEGYIRMPRNITRSLPLIVIQTLSTTTGTFS